MGSSCYAVGPGEYQTGTDAERKKIFSLLSPVEEEVT